MVVVEVEVQVVVLVMVAQETREVRRVRARSDARIVMRGVALSCFWVSEMVSAYAIE